MDSMNTAMPSNLSTEQIPEVSRMAWNQLLLKFPPTEPATTGHAGAHLQLAGLPGGLHVIGLPDDEWVLSYQQLLETQAKKLRRRGQLQTGVFYTPMPVAAYLTKRSLGTYLEQQRANIQQAMTEGQTADALALMSAVSQLKIIDPACGTGVFLVEALTVLTRFYQAIGQEYAELAGSDYAQQVYLNQLYGVDVDPLSVMIAECRLAQWVCRLDASDAIFRSMRLDSLIRWGDTLQQSPFPDIAEWDFILGNPPYVSEVRKQSERFQPLQAQSAYYQPKMDLCDAFLAWGMAHLKPHGQLVYVLPEYWTQRTSTASLRKHLWQSGSIREFWSFQDNALFKTAPGHHSSLVIWQKNQGSEISEHACQEGQLGLGYQVQDLSERYLQPAVFTLNPVSGKLLYGHPLEMAIMDKLSALPPLLDARHIQQGIVLPQGRLKKQDRERWLRHSPTDIPDQAGIFLLDDDELSALMLNDAERALLKPYYLPTGFMPFRGFKTPQPCYSLIYGNAENRLLIENSPEGYAQIRWHLDRFRPVLTSDFSPYGLHRARQPIWFEDARKILCPRQVMKPAFAVIDFPAYVNEGFYCIRTDENQDDPFYRCTLLNSTVGWYWFYKQKRKGHRLQIDKDVLRCFPKPSVLSPTCQEQLSLVARELSLPISQERSKVLWKQLNEQVYALYRLTDEEMAWLEKFRSTILPGE